MKRLINSKNWVMLLVLMALSVSSAMADEDDFLLSVRNVTHTATTIEFDLYLLDTDDTQTLEFAALQLGILLNSSIYGSGTLTVTYSNTGSGLDGDQQFVNTPNVVAPLAGYDGKTLIRLMPNSIPPVPPGAGSGTVISSSGYGTLLAHFTIESSVSFTVNSRAGLEFCSGVAVSPLYPTILYSYINGDSTPLPVTPGADALVDGDPLLNATLPVIFNVTGGGTYCQGDDGLPVGLDGSELNTTYSLYRNGLEVSSLTGTGNPLSFGNQTEGNYNVTATNEAGDQQMNGTAELTAVINTVTPPSSTPTLCINTPLTAITHTTTGATGIGTATGLPGGVTAGWASNTITISGTPTASGTFGYSIPLTGGCGSVNATGTITVTPAMTAGPASATPTLCINTPLTAITHTTTGATGIGTATGLPGGVTAAWASNTITISGTPTASGTFGYSIPLTGGCGSVNATGTITVTPANTINLTSGVGTNNQTVCSGTAIANITYLTTGATGAAVTGLPTGVTGNWSSGVVSISGTPSATGNYGYTVTLTGGCGTVTATGTINVNALPATSVITGSATPACSATGISYSVTSTAGSTYTWTVPEGATIATGQGTSNITVNFGTTNGNITVTERNAAGCNGTPVTLTISLQGCGLAADFSASPRTVCIGSSVLFTNLSTGTSSGTTYSWSFGSGASPLTASGPGPHSVTYSTAGSKDVTLTITEGASDTETKVGYITVNPANTIALTSPVGSNNQTVCFNTSVTTITYSTTGATGATFSGFPSGLTTQWLANVVTISGNPSIAGTFNYTVTLTGGCGTVNATGTITVNALPSAAGPITGPVAFTPGTSGIEYSVSPITAATSYLWSYSGTGVTINGAGNSVTLDFSASSTPGTLSVFGRNSCGDGAASTLDLTSATKALTLNSVFLEGLYDGAGSMRQAWGESGPQWPAGIADHITIELHSSSGYSTIVYSVSDVELSTTGSATITFPAEYSGSYYITIKHRNSIETTTAAPVSFAGASIGYSFNSLAAVYGGNLSLSGDGRYLIFSGDVNQDGFVDTQDYIGVDNDSYNYAYGYLITDVDGNGTVDTNDYIFIDNNNYNYVGVIHP